MRYVPRTKQARKKLLADAPAAAATRTLACGHTTDDEPVWTKPDGRKFFRCPQGCGIRRARR